MLKIYNIKEKIEYLEEVLELEYNEWADNKEYNREERLKNKIDKVKSKLNDNDFCKLILLDCDKLVGFISIFPHDSDLYKNLTPWYATMYVKSEYRGNGYSKILNDAILKEAKNRSFKEIYLKTTLSDYYEKFGATFLESFDEEEKLYKINLD